MKNNKVYIVLTDTSTLFTKMIKLFTKQPYNHASIALDSDLSDVYSFGRKTATNPFIGGFVKENIKAGLFKQADCAIYSFTVTDDEQLHAMKKYIQQIKQQQDHYRYNFLGLFGVLFDIPIKRKKAFFCSQFVASILNRCDRLEFNKPISLVTPYDLQARPEFQMIFQGKLKDYNKETLSDTQLAQVIPI